MWIIANDFNIAKQCQIMTYDFYTIICKVLQFNCYLTDASKQVLVSIAIVSQHVYTISNDVCFTILHENCFK